MTSCWFANLIPVCLKFYFLVMISTNDVVLNLFVEFKHSTRHEPVALEDAFLQCVPYPTCASNILNGLLLSKQNDGKSTLSMEQLVAVHLALNTHLSEFEGTAQYVGHVALDKDRIPCTEYYLGFPEDVRRNVVQLENSCVIEGKVNESRRAASRKTFRRGFWLADSYGFGKTRVIAGILAEYSSRRPHQAIYMCKNDFSWLRLKEELKTLNLNAFVYTRIEDFRFGAVDALSIASKLMLLIVPYKSLSEQDAIVKIRNWVATADFEGSVS